MSSSLSNHDSGLNKVLGTTAYDDELQPASIVRGPNSTKASSVMINGRAPTQGAGFTASIVPIEQRVTPRTASGDDKLLSGRECLVHKGGGETAGSAAAADEAAAVSSCERECGSNDAVHTDTNRRRNNHSECDSSATAASTDKYSCDLQGTMEVGGSGGGGGGSSSSGNTADHEEEVSLQVVQKATAEYSSSARESEAAGDYDHRDNNVDRDDHHEPHRHDNYNYDDEGGRDNYYEDEDDDDDDDACRTPTASEYRIPDIRPCPPPPRKSRAVLMNDRSCTIGTTSSSGKLCSAHQHHHHQYHHHHGGRLLLDFSKEVESMFPPLVQVNLGRKIKKARTA